MFRTQRLEINNQWTDLNNEYEKRRKDVRVATKDTQLNQVSPKKSKLPKYLIRNPISMKKSLQGPKSLKKEQTSPRKHSLNSS